MRENLKLLDNFTKVLVGISILGIAIGIYSLFFYKSSDSNLNPENKIASVIRPNNDTRLKRSGNIHWFPVSQDVDAFEQDVIFTGKDSVATIKFNTGAEVTLLPMSLITISNGNVTLNSGTIEVNLQKGSSLKVESFGEQFEVKDKTSFKVQNTPEVKRIVPIAPTRQAEEEISKTLATIPALKSFVQTQNISITEPATGENLPKFAGSSVNVKWKASVAAPDTTFILEFSPSETFDSIAYSTETTSTSAKVPVDVLTTGVNHFRVREAKGEAKAESSLYLLDNVKIEYLQPSNLADFQLEQVEAQGLLFEWTNPLRLPQRIQISNVQDFKNVLVEETLDDTRKNFNFNSEGNYFWRVGHVLENNVHWYDVASFSLSKKVPVSPLEIHDFPKVMDFRLTPKYEIGVNDLNKCEEYEFTLTKSEKVVLKTKTAEPKLKISNLEDGKYRVKVVGKLKNNELTKPATREFTVKNSLPLQAPKLKNKKVKILVFIQKAFDLIFPSAHAQVEAPHYNLEWEETPGATYEIQIAKNTPENIIIKEEVPVPRYKFIVTGAETFYWRVRTKLGNEYSPFSDFAVMEVEDRVGKISNALMTYPEDGTTLTMDEKNSAIEFKWREPNADASYFLEITTKKSGSKPKTIPVKGGNYRIAFKKIPPEIYWRVYAQSQFKNRSSDTEFFQVKTVAPEKPVVPVPDKLPAKFILRGSALMVQSANVMDFTNVNLEKRDETLSGTVFEFNGEFLPGQWKHRRSINAYLRYSSLSSSETELSEQKVGLEYGWLSAVEKPTKHNFYAGLHFYDNMNFKFGSDVNGNYSLMFVSGRYQYRRPLTEKINLELNAGLQFPKLGFNPLLVVKPGINYKFRKYLWVDVFGVFERFTHELKDTDNDSTVDIQYQNLGFGAGLTYLIGE